MRVLVALLSLGVLQTAASAATAAGPAPLPGAEEIAALKENCAAGDKVRCVHLGILYRRGMGTESDARKALELFVDACENGLALACAFTGDMAYRGDGVAASADHGEKLLRSACARRNEWACETMRRHGLIRSRTQAVS